MKNLFRICLILFVVLIPHISQSSTFTLLNPDDVKKDIVLKGSLADATIRSVFEAPIQAIMDIKHRELFLKAEYPLWKF